MCSVAHLLSVLRTITWCAPHSVAYAENFHGGDFFSVIWRSFVFGVRCLWRHNLTSFPCFQTNVLAKFVDIIWYAYFLHPLPLYELSALQVRLSEKNTQRYDTAVHNSKNFRLRVKTGEWNTLITTSEQFTTTKWGCTKVSLSTGSWALKVCSWTGWRTP